jgi:prolipoprotein diacylglyceryl transferase
VPVSHAVTFLATIPSPTHGAWYLGPFPLRAYAMCILVGIVVACVIAERRLRQRGAPKWMVLDVAVWAVPFGILGARLYHVITSPDAYFGKGGDPMGAFQIWNGGLGIWGGVAGGALGAWLACRRMGVPLTFVADALAPGLPVAQAIGRFGNWFNNELYGGHTSLPWGLRVYQYDLSKGRAYLDANGNPIELPGGPFHPTFLYEAVWDVGVALLVWLVDRRVKFGKGRAFALYVMAYTAGRFWVEAMRTDTAHVVLGMRVNNWVSLLVFAAALAYFLRTTGPREHVRVEDDGRLTLVTEQGEEIVWRRITGAGGAYVAGDAHAAGDADPGAGEPAEVGAGPTSGADGPPESTAPAEPK